MRRGVPPPNNPKIKISRPRPESLELDLDQSNVELNEEISHQIQDFAADNERQNRIARLEKLRRGEEILPEDDEEPEEVQTKTKVVQPESTESSVEGNFSLFQG